MVHVPILLSLRFLAFLLKYLFVQSFLNIFLVHGHKVGEMLEDVSNDLHISTVKAP